MARRSVLFTPGHRGEMLQGALDAEADVVIADLEDGVPPDARPTARETIVSVLSTAGELGGLEVLVRINPLERGGLDDIAALEPLAATGLPAGFVIPKVEGSETVRQVREHLDDAGLADTVWCLLESPRGVLHAHDIAAETGVSAVVFGGEDYMAAVGGARTEAGTELLYPRQHVVAAASAAGVDAIDGITSTIEDTERIRTDASEAATFGFDGKLAIHPAQLDPITEAFTPDPDQVAWAQRVVEAAESADGGAIRVDDEMIDAPLLERARSILEAVDDA